MLAKHHRRAAYRLAGQIEFKLPGCARQRNAIIIVHGHNHSGRKTSESHSENHVNQCRIVRFATLSPITVMLVSIGI